MRVGLGYIPTRPGVIEINNAKDKNKSLIGKYLMNMCPWLYSSTALPILLP